MGMGRWMVDGRVSGDKEMLRFPPDVMLRDESLWRFLNLHKWDICISSCLFRIIARIELTIPSCRELLLIINTTTPH